MVKGQHTNHGQGQDVTNGFCQDQLQLESIVKILRNLDRNINTIMRDEEIIKNVIIEKEGNTY